MEANLIRIAALAAISTWGITQAIKPSVKRYINDSWVKSGIRLAALVIGSGIGFAMQTDAMGAAAGASGAALSAVIVTAVKRRIK